MTAVMPDDAAAWVRAHAWTGTMRRTFTTTPGWLLAEAGAALLRAGRRVDDLAATVHDPHLYDRPWED